MIFSKLQGGYWPNVELVASKCEQIIGAERNGEDVTPFLAAGSAGKVRNASPKKQTTAKKTQPSKDVTPMKVPQQQAPAEEEKPVHPFKMSESEKFLHEKKDEPKA